MLRQKPNHVDILILGAGWTSTFLITQLDNEKITHAETTTTGRDGTIPFRFDPESSDEEAYKQLPAAHTVLVTFPLVGHGQSKHMTKLYRSVHGEENRWIQLGSSGIFNQCDDWNTEDSPYDSNDRRAIAEDELRECVDGCVLNLSGLYGGVRVPRTWIPRLAKTKEDVRKRKAVHFIHGEDVARAIIATHKKFTPGKRWVLADLRVYDWYDLIMSFSAMAEDEDGEESEEQGAQRLQFGKWVGELMLEEKVKALPREMTSLGRKIDSRGFWDFMGMWPRHKRLS
ncbi:hypothetical protein K504DRAFT_466477 [Pleomassaria siparia CBS 279.74]|uniref:NAD(P)-binding protein n=1 Tax=Pleomassaria siparia CBS 279.74 TaxID=1314801 RepID=A0A6G1KB57_9PLEO|nr:hypothetical protein K504DRAFT_466477 [Pleomassaria siparia CBS 279.74]